MQTHAIVLLVFVAVALVPIVRCDTSTGSTDTCDSCRTPLAGLQNSKRFQPSDYVRNLLNPDTWIKTPGGNVSYFNLSTTPALASVGIALTLVMLEPCGVILPHLHPRGSKAIYSITGKSLLVGFIQENRAQVMLNQITIGDAMAIPRGSIHFVQNLDCSPSMQIVGYNNEDPGLLTLGLNMFRFPDGPLSAGFNEPYDYINDLRSTIPAYALDVDKACRKKCGL